MDVLFSLSRKLLRLATVILCTISFIFLLLPLFDGSTKHTVADATGYFFFVLTPFPLWNEKYDDVAQVIGSVLFLVIGIILIVL